MDKKKIKIAPMDFPKDKDEINEWTAKYGKTPEYQSIHHFIMEDDTYRGLGEVINTNHEIFPIGDDEKKLAFTAKTDDGEIVAWVLIDVFDLSTQKPEMFLQYIVINPKYQHQGYGTEIAKEIFLSPEKYVGVKPKNIFAYIDIANAASIMLFSKFNFSFVPMENTHYFRAQTTKAKLLDSHFENIVFDEPTSAEKGSTLGE